MRPSKLWYAVAVAIVTVAFGTAWSLAQQPPGPPQSPEPPVIVEEREFDFGGPDFMNDGPGGGMGMMLGRHHRGMGFHRLGMDPAIREELGLSEEQVSKLRSLGFDAAKTGLRARTDMQIRRMELEELLQQDTPDKVELEKRIRALTEAQTALTRQRIEHRLAFRNTLTPEQRTKLRSLVQRRMAEWRTMRWRGREPGRGRREMRFYRRGPVGPPPQL
ncbi:MAG TPA: Spy/CpxP family protein refolding chaperone [Candidatus Xenobia bacterium]|nr:Spy/CpxP family protein refolding chaperone [Candidatus Xenobia bacterium]